MKGYDNYKETDDIWIDTIPSKWEFSNLKHFVNIIGGYAFKSEDYTENKGYPIIRIGDISNFVDVFNAKKANPNNINELDKFIIKRGDLLIAMTGATIGKNCMYESDEIAYLNQRVGLLRAKSKVNQRFLKYIIDAPFFKEFINLECAGSAQDNIGTGEISQFNLPVPSLEEQTVIASFLDYKTNLIDATIEKKNRLIELLKEKRQAVINEAVTRGLDPNTPMKNSGVEWLGEIPEDWSVVKLKHIVKTITDGAHISPDLSTPDFPFISTVDLQKGKIMWEKCLMTSESNYFYLKKNGCKPEIGDVLYSKDGTIGKTTVIKEDKEFVVASSLIITKPNGSKIMSDYLEYLLRSNISTLQIDALLSGVALRRVSLIKFSNLTIPLPPLEDQKKFLDENNEMHKNYLISLAKLKKSILLLQNYRQSLISEAVTGKIDVRNWQPPKK